MPRRRKDADVYMKEIDAELQLPLRPRLERVIRRLYASGSFSYEQLARMFQMNEQVIDDIVHERDWVDPLPPQREER